MTTDRSRLLRYSLRANAAFSFASGASFALAAAPLAAATGVPQAGQLRSIGLNLVVFAALLVWLSVRRTLRPGLVIAVIAADLAWVAATPPVVLAGVLSPLGNWAAAAVAEVVLLFAILQYAGLRRLRGSDPATT